MLRIALLLVSTLLAAAPVRGQDRMAPQGPYAVGFRVIEAYDESRAAGPKRDYTGALQPGTAARPMQIALWYPASADAPAEPMTYAEYLYLAQKKADFGPVTGADREAAVASLHNLSRFVFGEPASEEVVPEVLARQTAALREAEPAPGRFPLVLAGLGGTNTAAMIAEHLAAHGYVVATTPTLPDVARQQVTERAVAVETQTRNMEYLLGYARGLPFVDAGRLGVVGLNFDGYAALTFEMRNMQADAVVSLDGWETKAIGSGTMQESPYYDPLKLRVPYLQFVQAEAHTPAHAPDTVLFDALRYADRRVYVVRGLSHVHYVGDLAAWPSVRADHAEAFDFLFRTVRLFFDAHVRGDAEAAAWLARPAAEKGYAAGLLEVDLHAAPLPPVPTPEEFVDLLEADLPEAARVLRAAKAADPDVDLVTERTLALYAFRARQAGDVERLVDLGRLRAETFAASAQAHFDLGEAYREAGRPDEAAAAYRRALAALPADPGLDEAERAALERRIRERL